MTDGIDEDIGDDDASNVADDDDDEAVLGVFR